MNLGTVTGARFSIKTYRRGRALVAVVLLSLYVILALGGSLRRSATFDETAYIAAGYSYWKTSDFRLNSEAGVLPQRWVALPLLFGDHRFPPLEGADWEDANHWRIGHGFLYRLGNDATKILMLCRATVVVLGACLGYLIYRWGLALGGTVGGITALACFTFCPSMIAHGGLATSDMAASLAFLASLGAYWRLLQRVTVLRVLGSAVAAATLFATKMSAPVIVPVFVALCAIVASQRRPLTLGFRSCEIAISGFPKKASVFACLLLVHAVIIADVLWLLYEFRFDAEAPNGALPARAHPQRPIAALTGGLTAGPAIRTAHDFRLLPEAYLRGAAFVLQHAERRASFLNGTYSDQGWWFFFPYAFCAKTPAATLGLFAAAAGYLASRAGCWRSLRVRVLAYRLLPLAAFLAAYWLVALSSNLNIGHRHLTPVYPPMFVLIGAAAGRWLRQRPSTGPFLATALLFMIAESLAVWPHHLAFFNVVAGGPQNGYRHLVDSSLDWGQDLPGLATQLAESRHVGRGQDVYLSYFGTADPEYYGLSAVRLRSFMDFNRDAQPEPPELGPGVYCISATMLQHVYPPLSGRWTQAYEDEYKVLRRMDLARHPSAASRRWRPILDSLTSHASTRLTMLQFGRLCAYLRGREPDGHAGYSILIYHLSAADLRRALEGAPPIDE